MPAATIKKAIHTCCPEILRPTLARIEASEIGYRLAKGTFWTVAGGVISRGLGILASVVVARTLGKGSFGELGIISSTVGLFQVFAGFGLGLTATKYVAEYRTSNPQKAGRIISLGWMVSAVTGGLCVTLLAIFAPWLAAHALAAPHLSGLLRIASIALLISSLNAAQNGALSGFEAFKTIAERNLIAGVLNFPIVVIGVLVAGLEGAVWGTVISCAVNWFACHLALRRESRRFGVPLTPSDCLQEVHLLWEFSLPAVLSALMVTPVTWVCNAMLVNQPDGYSNLGIFTAAASLSIAVVALNGTLGQVLLPVCVTSFKKGNNRFDFLNIVLPWAIGIVFILPIMTFPEILGIVFGRDYAGSPAERTVIYVMLYTLIIAYKQGVARNFVAGSYMWWSLGSNLFWGAIAVSCMYILRKGGVESRAVAFLLAYALNTVIFIPFYVRRNLCPRHLLLSRPAILIWVCIVLVCFLGLALRPPVAFRVLVILISYAFVAVSFKALWRLHNGHPIQ